jgi:hypothetical protein
MSGCFLVKEAARMKVLWRSTLHLLLISTQLSMVLAKKMEADFRLMTQSPQAPTILSLQSTLLSVYMTNPGIGSDRYSRWSASLAASAYQAHIATHASYTTPQQAGLSLLTTSLGCPLASSPVQ